MSAFSLLHQRSCAGLQLITLCKTMDIIAISTKEYLLLYRTMSWEKIYSIIYQEEFPTKVVTSLCFHPSGKYLSIGCSDSSIVMLDIESKQFCPLRIAITTRVGVNNNHHSPIISCNWQHFQGLTHNVNIIDDITNSILKNNPVSNVLLSNYPQIWKYDGLMQVQRIGMMEYSDPNVIIGSSSIHTKCINIMQITSQYLHFALAENGYLQCHVLGIYPLFSINLHESHAINQKISYKSIQSSCYKHNITYTYNDNTSKQQSNYELACFNYLTNVHGQHHQISQKSFFNALGWYEQAAYLQVTIELNLTKLHDLILSYGRKWRDACKVVIPKLNILQDLLNTYQLNMTTIEFCYTITLCGLWHPAAATAFSQHWNDQGVQRLKSSIDGASRSIIKSLLTKAIPIVQNTLLASRELLAIHEHINKQSNILIDKQELHMFLKPFISLVTYFEQLLIKLDDVLYESRLAREAMLLYIQFIKDCILEVNNNNSNSTTPQTKPDPSMRSKYHKLFDPHHIRAASKGPQAQAEYVCATHLYAYLQDCSNTNIITTTNSNNNSSSNEGSILKSLITEESIKDRDPLLAQEIFELSEKISIDHSNTIVAVAAECLYSRMDTCKAYGGENQYHQSGIDSSDLMNSKSVLYTIKLCKELSQSVQYLAHDGMSNAISPPPLQGNINPATNSFSSLENTAYHRNSENIRLDFNTTTKDLSQRSSSESHILESNSILIKNIDLQILSHHNNTINDSAIASLYDCMLTATVDLSSNELIIICYGDDNNTSMFTNNNSSSSSSSNESIMLYCTKFSLVDIFESISDQEIECKDDRSAIEFKVDDLKISFYTRTSKSNNSVETSLLLTLSDGNSSTSSGIVYLFRLLLTSEEIKYTSIEYNNHYSNSSNSTKNIKDQADSIVVSNAILEQIAIQSISTNICFCRLLPFKDIGMLVTEGERGVAVISNLEGKLLVLDIEADEEVENDDEATIDDNDDD